MSFYFFSHSYCSNKYLLIIEEGSPGGFAAHAVTLMANGGHLDNGCRVRSLTLPDSCIDHDSQDGQLASAGLDAVGILNSVRALAGLGNSRTLKARKMRS